MKSKDEEFCKSEFNIFLSRFYNSTEYNWEDVPQKNEPPDYYLDLKGTRYAVEVTKLMEKVSVGTDKPLPLAIVRDFLQRFVKDEIETTVINNSDLAGIYTIYFSQPINNFTNIKNDLKTALLDYIRNTKGQENAPSKIIFGQGKQKCEITKSHNKGSKVLMAGPWPTKWKGEIEIDMQNFLVDRISEKLNKLKKNTHPKILLLHNKYAFVTPENYRNIISRISALNDFHTIYIAQKNEKGIVLCSQNPDWL